MKDKIKIFRRFILLLVTLLCSSQSHVFSDNSADITNAYIRKQFVIIKSTKNFKEAESTAREAAEKLNLKFDSRDLSEDPIIGLTFPKKECDDNGFPYPCYVARGRYDDGTYLSVENSSTYRGFKKGLFIVIAASDVKGSKSISKVLADVRRFYPDAYAKITSVYMGCIH